MLGTENIVDFTRYRYLNIDISDGIAEVVISRPEYDARGHWELGEVFRDLDSDTRVRASLIYWADPPTNYDLQLDIYQPPSLEVGERFARYTQEMREAREGVYTIINSIKPIVSVLMGDVPVGAGLAAAILADVSIAGAGAAICDSHVSMGLPAGDHACLWVPYIGLARAKRLLLASEAISGAEAAAAGLVSLSVPDAEALRTGREYAAKLASQPRNAVRMTKRALNQHLKQAALISFDVSVVMEQLGMLDGDMDAMVAADSGPAEPGAASPESGPDLLPSAVAGDRTHAG